MKKNHEQPLFSPSSLQFLEQFLHCSGPAGFEQETAAAFRNRLADCADEIHTDVMGNTIAVKNPKAEFRVMLAAHCDEVGLQVVHADEHGMIYFRKSGGVDKQILPGREVEILTRGGQRVPGVIGRKPIHLQTAKELDTVTEISELWIDIGAESAEEVFQTVAVGDPIAFRTNFRTSGKHAIMSKGLDDKIGAFVIAEAFRELASKSPREIAVYAVGSVQEEMGSRGIPTGTFAVNPNAAVCVDVGFATDYPGMEKTLWGDIRLGGGVMIARNADTNPVLTRMLTDQAVRRKIAFQSTCGYRPSGETDASKIQLSRAGVATAVLSIPNRYMHTPVEMCDLRDVRAAVDLIVATIRTWNGRETFQME